MITPELTRRGRQILELLAEGLSSIEISQKLDLKIDTIKTHSRILFLALGATNRTQAVAMAYRKGLLPVDTTYIPPPPLPPQVVTAFLASAQATVAGHPQARRIAADALNVWTRANR